MPLMSTNGFTIVELLVVMVVTGILASVLFGPLDSLFSSTITNMNKVAVTADSHNVLDAMQNTISLSSGFLAHNYVTDPVVGTWTASNNGSVLITSNYATNTNELQDTAGNRTLTLSGTGCSTPIQNNYVFFVSNGTLYRRTLKSTTTPCSGYSNGQVQTCAAGVSIILYPGCKDSSGNSHNDAVLMSGVTSFTVQYYASPADPDTDTITDPTAASTVVLNVTTQVGPGSQAITANNSLRVTHLN